MTESSLLVPLRDLKRADKASRRAEFAQEGKSEGTWRVYNSAWERFEEWCELEESEPGPPTSPEVIADYAIVLCDAGKSQSTIRVALSAIAHKNRLAGVSSPLLHPQLAEVVAGIYRRCAKEQRGRGPSEPLLPEDMRKFVTRLKQGLIGTRDLALLTFGLAGGFRRSELVRLRIEDLSFEPQAVRVHLPWSKSDQEGDGHDRRICYGENSELCPVRNLQLWISASGIRSGPIFRTIINKRVQDRGLSARRIDQIIREYARAVLQINPNALPGTKYSAHSLRSGLCTAAAIAGKPEWEIRDHVGHKSSASTGRYIRAAKRRQSTLTKGIGL